IFSSFILLRMSLALIDAVSLEAVEALKFAALLQKRAHRRDDHGANGARGARNYCSAAIISGRRAIIFLISVRFWRFHLSVCSFRCA
ncbi:MAG: hypothetical protein ACX939_13265, partial [Hyphococcus sp.]